MRIGCVLFLTLLLGCVTANPEDSPNCPGMASCDGRCVDPQISAEHCGGCGKACAARQQCVGGACQDQVGDCRTEGPCAPGYYCYLNSGECKQGCLSSTECRAREVCSAERQCQCDSSSHECGGACVSNSEVATCGSRCAPCPTDPNGQPTCEAGQCKFRCNTGFYQCAGASSCTECCQDSHCTAPGTICQASSCVTGRRCLANNECAYDELCEARLCKAKPPGLACTTHAECPNGQVCQGAVCAVVSCPEREHGWASSVCPTGSGCRRKRCVDLVGKDCTTWSDCGTDYDCSARTCSAVLSGAKDCKTNSNCTAYRTGYNCINGHCLMRGGPGVTCQADNECAYNYVCGLVNKTGKTSTCTYGCGAASLTCPLGYTSACDSLNCTSSLQPKSCCAVWAYGCPASNCSGLSCVNSACVSNQVCTSTSQCLYGETCDAGRCKYSPGAMISCADDRQCGNGLYCDAGKCEGLSSGPPRY